MNFEKYVELHILENQEGKVIVVDLYYHENRSQEYDNFVKTYKTLRGAMNRAEDYGVKIKQNVETYY